MRGCGNVLTLFRPPRDIHFHNVFAFNPILTGKSEDQCGAAFMFAQKRWRDGIKQIRVYAGGSGAGAHPGAAVL
jgi:hypothetical protein